MKAYRVAAGFMLVVGLAGCGGSDQDAASEPVMPDVVGQQLDDAQSRIKDAGIDDEVDVSGGGTFGIVDESNWQVCDQSPAAGDAIKEAPHLTVDRSCDDGSATEPEETTTSASAYTYAGPKYEVVTVDKGAGMGVLDQYWVYTDKLDYSTDAYKDRLKLLISDVARSAGTNKLIVQVVTDKEIAEAEATSTYEDFEAEHGTDYAMNVIPEKEKAGWVAWYAGGIDYETGELSDSDTAFGIDWFPASDKPTSERWKP